MGLKPAGVAAVVVCVSLVLRAQDAVDLGVVDRIKSEAFGRSQVMDHLRQLTDTHGPRLTGSIAFEEAAKWTTDRLTQYGLSNVHIERFSFGRRWSADQYSLELLAPTYMRLLAMPLAWSDSTRLADRLRANHSLPLSTSRSSAVPSGSRKTLRPTNVNGRVS